MRSGPPNSLASYVPRAVVERHLADPTAPREAYADDSLCALLFADVVGFSTLAERLASSGSTGVETIHRMLNGVLEPLVEIITLHGGDVISFAGDSAIGAWFAEKPEAMAEKVSLATHAGIATRDRLHGLVVADTITIELRIVVVADNVSRATVGGTFGRWHYLLHGPALEAIKPALSLNAPGEVIATPAAVSLLNEAQIVAHGAEGHALVKWVGVDPAMLLNAALPVIDVPEVVTRYVPHALTGVLASRPVEWLAELRLVTIAFIGLRAAEEVHERAVDWLQKGALLLQLEAERNGGVLTAFMGDEKGTYGIVVWGLPGAGFEDNARRAARTALAVRDEVASIGMSSAAGLATGQVLCAPLGGAGRYEYAVVGEKTIIAARLMAFAGAGVLADEPTARALAGAFEMGRLVEHDFKGRLGRVAACEITGPVHGSPSLQTDSCAPSLAFGRDAELALLDARLDDLVGGVGATIIVEGEAGIGKSTLLVELVAGAERRGITCWSGEATDIERSTPYFAWRDIVRGLVTKRGEDLLVDPAEAIDERPDDWLPVLEDVVPLGFEDNETTLRMSAEARSESVVAVVSSLLEEHARTYPTLVVLEDVHWMDSRSWAIAARMGERAAPLLFVLVCRSGYPGVQQRLASMYVNGARQLTLAPLDLAGTTALIGNFLAVSNVAPRLAQSVHSQSGGHPLYSRELIAALRERQGLALAAGGADLVALGELAGTLSIPERVKYIVTSRVDRLLQSEDDKLTIMLCSVVGDVFPTSVIELIHPLSPRREDVLRSLETLCECEFVRKSEELSGTWRFRHDLIREAIYDLVPQTLKVSLHRRVARWVETTHAGQLDHVYNLLAYHWAGAEDRGKSFEFARRAGLQALQRHAALETIRHVEAALALFDVVEDDEKRAAMTIEFENALGFAYYSLGSADHSRQHFAAALRAMGYVAPVGRRQHVLYTLGEALRQLRYQLAKPRLLRGRQRMSAQLAYAISLRLGHLAYFDNNVADLGFHLFRCLNLAEQLGTSSELAMMYTSMTAPFAAMPWPRIAERYDRMGRTLEDVSDDPSARAQSNLFRSVYYCGLGRLDEARTNAEAGAAYFCETGDLRRWEECMVMRGYVAAFSGDLVQGRDHYAALAASAERRRDSQTNGWGMAGILNAQLCLGNLSDARRAYARLALLEIDALTRVARAGLGAATLIETDAEAALALAREALMLLEPSRRPSGFSIYPSVAWAADVLLTLRAAGGLGVATSAREIDTLARRACAYLGVVAHAFPVARPQAHLRSGQYYATLGNMGRASREWRSGARLAAELGMRFELALLQANLAEHGSPGEEAGVLAPDALDVDPNYLRYLAVRGGVARALPLGVAV